MQVIRSIFSIKDSLMCLLCRLFLKSYDNFIEKCDLLNSHLNGCHLNCRKYVTKIANDNKEYILGVFIDLKNACDMADHRLLMKR